MITQSERDFVIIQLHNLRASANIIDEFVNYVNQYIPDAVVIISKQLFQVWLRKFVVEIMNVVARYVNITEEHEHVILSEVDQNVLYHITGYMAMKVRTASRRYKKLKNMDSLIESLTTKEPQHTGNFVEQYHKWVEKQSRGGLLYPVPSFYLLIREFDRIYQYHTYVSASNLRAHAIDKTVIEAAMHDAFMVKYIGIILLRHLMNMNQMHCLYLIT